eukprot:2899583-Karenia_brevis.AAC.1
MTASLSGASRNCLRRIIVVRRSSRADWIFLFSTSRSAECVNRPCGGSVSEGSRGNCTFGTFG